MIAMRGGRWMPTESAGKHWSSSGRLAGLASSTDAPASEAAPEDVLRAAGYARIAGVDEAGRGPLAGPVVAAAVILPHPCPIEGINDSKRLTVAQRERVYHAILEGAVTVGIGISDVDLIDRVNILQATRLAMRQAVLALHPAPEFVLVDYVHIPDLPYPQRGLAHGDRLCPCIGAASIIAKVTRDRLLVELDREYPHYGFAAHKGYGTPQHLARIARYGVCPAHRRSFAPVRDFLEQPVLFSQEADSEE